MFSINKMTSANWNNIVVSFIERFDYYYKDHPQCWNSTAKQAGLVIVNDSSKFEIIHNGAIKLVHKLENRIRLFLGKLKKDSVITESTYNNLTPTKKIFLLDQFYAQSRHLSTICQNI